MATQFSAATFEGPESKTTRLLHSLLGEKVRIMASNSAIAVSRDQLLEIIEETVNERMKSVPQVADDDLKYEKIGDAVARGMAKNQRRKVTYGEYMLRTHSSFHPDPALPNGPPLTRQYWINGHHEDAHQLLDAEINLLNQITHSGRYINRLVEVLVQLEGLDEVVQIRYDNTKNSLLPNFSRSLVEMLTKIVEAQAAEREEMEIVEEAKRDARRRFGKQAAIPAPVVVAAPVAPAPSPVVTTQTCSTCGQTKNISSFFSKTNSVCRKCVKARSGQPRELAGVGA